MSHLKLETIARLVEEAPDAAEAAHLADCAACRAELDGMREDVHALSLLPDVTPAPDAWASLEQRLEAEGLIRRRRAFGAFALPGGSMQRLSWAAAVVVVFAAGTLAGRMSAEVGQPIAQLPAGSPEAGRSAGSDPLVEPAGPAAPAPSAEARPAPTLAAGDEPNAEAPAPARQAPRTAQPGRSPALTFAASGTPSLPRNMEEAAQLLRETEEHYLAALTRYAELATQAEPGDPVARLAALQSIVLTTQAALSQAPADPVINGYHLTAVAQRDATLRHVAAASNDRWY